MDEPERKIMLKKVQTALQWLWTRLENLEGSTMTRDRNRVAKYRERQELLESQESVLLALGREFAKNAH